MADADYDYLIKFLALGKMLVHVLFIAVSLCLCLYDLL